MIERLTPSQYEVLRDLTDMGPTDATSLEADIIDAVQIRIELGRAMLEAARILADHPHALVRRSAVSRAYYAAYQTGRAVVFAVQRRDEDDHERLARMIDDLPGLTRSVGDRLKELRRLRNEMDYSPCPGPDPKTEYEPEEIQAAIRTSIMDAENIIGTLSEYLAARR